MTSVTLKVFIRDPLKVAEKRNNVNATQKYREVHLTR